MSEQAVSARESVRPLPTRVAEGELQERLDALAPWFYVFRFENGAATEVRSAETQVIHEDRAELIFPLLDRLLAGRWERTRCLDIGCHEGWFAAQLAVRGAREVLAVDVRPEHLQRAGSIREVTGLDRIRLEHASLRELASRQPEPFDLTFFVGVLYHLSDPVEALRAVRRLTGGVVAIETQVARAAPHLEAAWGSGAPRFGAGVAVLPFDAAHAAPGESVALVPTLEALYALLHAAGFARTYLSVPDAGMGEQYRAYDRVVVFAFAS